MIKFSLILLLFCFAFSGITKAETAFFIEFGINSSDNASKSLEKVSKDAADLQQRLPAAYSLSVKSGDRDISSEKNPAISYQKNYIQFKIKPPLNQNANNFYLRYCLISESDSVCLKTDPGESVINFVTLVPGNYTIKAHAFQTNSGDVKYAVNYTFHVVPPWWQQFWFKLVFFISVLLILNYLFINYNLNQFILKKAFFEQRQSIIAERQRISSEIHDDIGSGLFAIHLFADLATKKRNDVEEIKQISTMVTEVTDKIKEIIWSTNVENDNLENLIYYIQFQVTRLFEHSTIHFESTIPDDIPDLDISSQSRRNIFLIVMELAHNALKHSKATNVKVDIHLSEEFLTLSVIDNGIGINLMALKKNAMGLENVRARVKGLKGSLDLQNINGSYLVVKLPLRELAAIGYIHKKQRWKFLASELFLQWASNKSKKVNS